jgi:hypothetical protein
VQLLCFDLGRLVFLDDSLNLHIKLCLRRRNRLARSHSKFGSALRIKLIANIFSVINEFIWLCAVR